MKKSLVVFATLMMFLLVACGGTTQTGASSASRTVVDSGSVSRTTVDSLSGTYVGKNGSVLTLFPDGTSEYYYMLYSSMDIDKGAGNWNYKDGALTWMYNDKPIVAQINEQSALFFTLEQTDEWNREQFIKASDIAKNRTVDEYQELLKTTLNRPEMDNYDTELNRIYDFDGINIEIPHYWAVSERTDEEITFYAESAQDDTALLMIDRYSLDVSGGIFEQIGTEVWDEIIDSYEENICTVLKTVTKCYVNGIPTFQGMVRTTADGYTFNQTLTYFYDENSGTLLLVQLIVTDNTIFKYDSDYAKIVNSVRATDLSAASSSSSDFNGGGRTEKSSTTAGTNGVTPELKEFLDSYEAYMDQYIAFMQKYENSDGAYSMLYDYLDMMLQYADFAKKLDQYDTDKMSAADSAYYLEVTMRVTKKLYAAAIQ